MSQAKIESIEKTTKQHRNELKLKGVSPFWGQQIGTATSLERLHHHFKTRAMNRDIRIGFKQQKKKPFRT